MRVLLVTHFYPPEELSMSHLMHELAEAMAGRGHDVHVLTGYPNWPTGRWLEGYQPRGFTTTRLGALSVHRFPSLPSPNGSFLHRVLDFKSFEYGIRFYGRRLPRPDLVYVHVPPNDDACAALALARNCGCASIVNVQDIHPDSAIELGYIKNRLAIWLLRRQQRRLLAAAACITTIGAGLKRRLVSNGVPASKIQIIPNWIDSAAIVPMNRLNPLRKEWGIHPDRFVVLYAGTLGRVHNTRVLMEAAKALNSLPGILFLLVGQGYDFENNRRLVTEWGLGNVLMHDPVPRTRLSEMQALADVSVVTLRSGFGQTSVPSKVLGYMSAGRGVVAAVDADCDTADVIRMAECGVVLPPEDVEGLVWTLRAMAIDGRTCERWGHAARRHVLHHLDRKVVLAEACQVLEGFRDRGTTPMAGGVT